MRFALFTLMLLLTSEASASHAQLKKALSAFEQGNCKSSVPILESLRSNQLENENDYLALYHALAICYQQLGDAEKTKDAVQNLLFLKPSYEFDPYSTPNSLVQLQKELQSHMQQKQTEIEKAKEAAQEKLIPKEVITQVIERDTKTTLLSPASAFVPFGVPQFENQDTVKGALVASAEIAMLGVNIGTYWYKRSLLEPGSYASVADDANLRKYNISQAIQFTSLAIGLAVYVYGVIDGYLSRKPIVTEQETIKYPSLPLQAQPAQ